ncbi:glycoside hydrolase family 75 protein [Streptomyces sp. NPDC028635]|uniref:glycoside hydrolase family 75 protein n=1 Tax=Streptomyces sp. NPDC028635 TaxID=3154800 RepID=UPI0033F82D08
MHSFPPARTRSRRLPLRAAAAVLAAGVLPALAAGRGSGAAFAHEASVASALAHEGSVAAADLLAEVRSCKQVSHGLYRTDQDKAPAVPVCGAKGAVFFTADMDIDCDGRPSARCSRATDSSFQDDTAFHQSDGRPLRADRLPFVVVPGASDLWDYRAAGVRGGGVAAVIHDDQVEYAIVGDVGPKQIIGEASYATAAALGLDPDPERGGTDAPVTYILFTGSQVTPLESHTEAVTLGERLAREFLKNN